METIICSSFCILFSCGFVVFGRFEETLFFSLHVALRKCETVQFLMTGETFVVGLFMQKKSHSNEQQFGRCISKKFFCGAFHHEQSQLN